MAKLTKRAVDAAKPDPKKDVFLWDSEIPGFGLRTTPAGRKRYVFRYRNQERQCKFMTLGPHGVLTPDEARRRASRLLADVKDGKDPAAERAERNESPTVSELSERYLDEHAQTRKKPRSLAEDRRLLNAIVVPALGKRMVAEVTKKDIARFHHNNRERPYQANRVLALLSKMFNLAEHWGLRPDGSNPTRHVEKFPEKKRERFLSKDELTALGTALSDSEQAGAESVSVITAIRLLILTGARLNEILSLEWAFVDMDDGVLRLPDSKTGAKAIPLGAAAIELLQNVPHVKGNPYVCPGKKQGNHLVGLPKAWKRILDKAGLSDIRLHDLRHSFASVGASAGMGLPIIGALLGHKEMATTQRYAHLAADPLKEAANEITTKIASAMKGEAGGKVVKLKKAT